MSAGFSPENIYERDGRWYFGDDDVSDVPVWWCCPEGHSYQETISNRVAGIGCPDC